VNLRSERARDSADRSPSTPCTCRSRSTQLCGTARFTASACASVPTLRFSSTTRDPVKAYDRHVDNLGEDEPVRRANSGATVHRSSLRATKAAEVTQVRLVHALACARLLLRH
jgi:hypothetical protein